MTTEFTAATVHLQAIKHTSFTANSVSYKLQHLLLFYCTYKDREAVICMQIMHVRNNLGIHALLSWTQSIVLC